MNAVRLGCFPFASLSSIEAIAALMHVDFLNAAKFVIAMVVWESAVLSMAASTVAAQPSLVSLQRVERLTGEPSPNRTDRVNVYGTDLGHTFEHNGKLYFVFGDTFGSPGHPTNSGSWRSNALAWSSDSTPHDGIRFDAWLTDAFGNARAMIEGKHQPNSGLGEVTKIPTAAWSDGMRMYLWFMSVSYWGKPGEWDVGYAELAVSDDHGVNWSLTGQRRSSDSGFVQLAVTEHEGYLYQWGIPSGRLGGVRLARVPRDRVTSPSEHRYFNGTGWSAQESAATLIVPAPVGELSVVWNPYFEKWMMTYLNKTSAAIELRVADHPHGPWSGPVELVDGAQYPGLYGAYMHPRLLEEEGRIVYFTMSQWQPYDVFLMRAEFEPLAREKGASVGGAAGCMARRDGRAWNLLFLALTVLISRRCANEHGTR